MGVMKAANEFVCYRPSLLLLSLELSRVVSVQSVVTLLFDFIFLSIAQYYRL